MKKSGNERKCFAFWHRKDLEKITVLYAIFYYYFFASTGESMVHFITTNGIL